MMDITKVIWHLPKAKRESWQTGEIKNVSLAKGSNVLKVVAEKGGFTFKEIEISDK